MQGGARRPGGWRGGEGVCRLLVVDAWLHTKHMHAKIASFLVARVEPPHSHISAPPPPTYLLLPPGPVHTIPTPAHAIPTPPPLPHIPTTPSPPCMPATPPSHTYYPHPPSHTYTPTPLTYLQLPPSHACYPPPPSQHLSTATYCSVPPSTLNLLFDASSGE